MTALLSVRNLRTEFLTRDGVLPAVADVSFDLQRGEVLGLVGESGSGKSVTGFSIIGLIDPPGRIAAGSIVFDGIELIGAGSPPRPPPGTPSWDGPHSRGSCAASASQ